MKEIELTRGYVAKVDDEDYIGLSGYKWYANVQANAIYAGRQYRDTTTLNKKGKSKQVLISMHRQILNVPKGRHTDHIDHDGLNNQKSNLRICNRAQNLWNQRTCSNELSRVKT